MAVALASHILSLGGFLRLAFSSAPRPCPADSTPDGACMASDVSTPKLLPHKLECDDHFWQVLDTIHPLSSALSSWASSCEEEVREDCHGKSQEAAFLFACAKEVLAPESPPHQRSALLLLRHAAGLAADSTWTGHRLS